MSARWVKRIAANTSSLFATLKSWQVPNFAFVFSAIVLWFAFSPGSLCLAGAVQQESGTGTGTPQIKTAARITAAPARVKIAGRAGTTDIAWNTGDGSTGFIFVTANGRPPVLVAKGTQGSRVVSWIGTGAYVFKLYGDAERNTLLATVTVTGVAERGAPAAALSWRNQLHWLLIGVLVVVLYVAVYLSSAGPVRTTFPTEPTTSPRQLHVLRNLLLGIAAFICVDGVIFHSGLYVSILAPGSYAGGVERITLAEKKRAPSGLKEVLVLGDSRIAEGFSASLANDLGSPAGLKFVSLAEPAASANTWYYMLREVDPTKRRYTAIIIPYGLGYEPNNADPLRISMTAPLLRYEDSFHFASGFQRWSGRFRAFIAGILRGSAYQDDVVDLLAHPIARIKNVRQADRTHFRSEYKGRDYDLVGTSYDAATGQVTFAPKLTEAQRLAFWKSLIQPSQSDTEYSLKLQRDWIPRIINRYADSPTAIVLTPLPRGPFLELRGFSKGYKSVLPDSVIQRTSFSLPRHTFEFLEKPEYYFDAFHLNAKGRQKFTETLVSELIGRLAVASKPQANSGVELLENGPSVTDETN
ncbi:MAG TPA: hypothetical protein VFQ83_01240 [Candidatus Udaeobacter sp.]|nr:hypothetical protein [Candidatus Udaeobacter sp.]